MTKIYAPSKPSLDEFLAHHGVKGMKWGVTRDEALLNRIAGRRMRASGGTREERKAANAKAKSDWKNYKNTTSRKERKSDRKKALEEKANFLLEAASKEPMRLFSVVGSDGSRQMQIGQVFLDKAIKTGRVDVKYTDLTDLYIDA